MFNSRYIPTSIFNYPVSLIAKLPKGSRPFINVLDYDEYFKEISADIDSMSFNLHEKNNNGARKKIKAWIHDVFRNFLAKDYDGFLEVNSREDLPKDFKAPGWLLRMLEENPSFLENNPHLLFTRDIGFVSQWEAILDYFQYLFQEKPGVKINEISFPEMFQEHERWAARGSEGEVRQGPPVEGDDIKTVLSMGGHYWAEITSERELKFEGRIMGHCVGTYWDKVQEGTTVIFSLRDSSHNPHVTIEVQNAGGYVAQIKGKGNRAAVPKYWNSIVTFLNKATDLGILKPSATMHQGDGQMNGVFKYKDTYYSSEDLVIFEGKLVKPSSLDEDQMYSIVDRFPSLAGKLQHREDLFSHMIAKNGTTLYFLPNASEKIKLKGLDQNINNISYITDPSLQLQYFVAGTDTLALSYANNLDERIALSGVSDRPFLVRGLTNVSDYARILGLAKAPTSGNYGTFYGIDTAEEYFLKQLDSWPSSQMDLAKGFELTPEESKIAQDIYRIMNLKEKAEMAEGLSGWVYLAFIMSGQIPKEAVIDHLEPYFIKVLAILGKDATLLEDTPLGATAALAIVDEFETEHTVKYMLKGGIPKDGAINREVISKLDRIPKDAYFLAFPEYATTAIVEGKLKVEDAIVEFDSAQKFRMMHKGGIKYQDLPEKHLDEKHAYNALANGYITLGDCEDNGISFGIHRIIDLHDEHGMDIYAILRCNVNLSGDNIMSLLNGYIEDLTPLVEAGFAFNGDMIEQMLYRGIEVSKFLVEGIKIDLRGVQVLMDKRGSKELALKLLKLGLAFPSSVAYTSITQFGIPLDLFFKVGTVFGDASARDLILKHDMGTVEDFIKHGTKFFEGSTLSFMNKFDYTLDQVMELGLVPTTGMAMDDLLGERRHPLESYLKLGLMFNGDDITELALRGICDVRDFPKTILGGQNIYRLMDNGIGDLDYFIANERSAFNSDIIIKFFKKGWLDLNKVATNNIYVSSEYLKELIDLGYFTAEQALDAGMGIDLSDLVDSIESNEELEVLLEKGVEVNSYSAKLLLEKGLGTINGFGEIIDTYEARDVFDLIENGKYTLVDFEDHITFYNSDSAIVRDAILRDVVSYHDVATVGAHFYNEDLVEIINQGGASLEEVAAMEEDLEFEYEDILSLVLEGGTSVMAIESYLGTYDYDDDDAVEIIERSLGDVEFFLNRDTVFSRENALELLKDGNASYDDFKDLVDFSSEDLAFLLHKGIIDRSDLENPDKDLPEDVLVPDPDSVKIPSAPTEYNTYVREREFEVVLMDKDREKALGIIRFVRHDSTVAIVTYIHINQFATSIAGIGATLLKELVEGLRRKKYSKVILPDISHAVNKLHIEDEVARVLLESMPAGLRFKRTTIDEDPDLISKRGWVRILDNKKEASLGENLQFLAKTLKSN